MPLAYAAGNGSAVLPAVTRGVGRGEPLAHHSRQSARNQALGPQSKPPER